MFEALLQNTKFLLVTKRFYKKYENKILDIVLFGSVVKGKPNPKDIDILLLMKEEESVDLAYELRTALKVYYGEISVVTKTYKSLGDINFLARESFLQEGYSLIHKKSIANHFGYTNLILFRYSLIDFSKSNRMRFYYSLYGRNNQGMLKKLRLHKFSETIIFSPVVSAEELRSYFRTWKIKFTEIPLLIPRRIAEHLELNDNLS